MCSFLLQPTAPSLEMEYTTMIFCFPQIKVATKILSKYQKFSFSCLMTFFYQSLAWKAGCIQSSPLKTSSLTKGKPPPESHSHIRIYSYQKFHMNEYPNKYLGQKYSNIFVTLWTRLAPVLCFTI